MKIESCYQSYYIISIFVSNFNYFANRNEIELNSKLHPTANQIERKIQDGRRIIIFSAIFSRLLSPKCEWKTTKLRQ